MIELLKIMIICRQNEYSRSVICHLLLLIYWLRTKHPLYKLWLHRQAMFNEESCEAQLSSLARISRNDTTRHEVQKYNQDFILGSATRELFKKFEPEKQERKVVIKTEWREYIASEAPELKETVIFFQQKIRELKTKQFQSYTGKAEVWRNKSLAYKTYQKTSSSVWRKKSTTSELERIIGKVRGGIKSNWLAPNIDKWREEVDEGLAPVPDFNNWNDDATIEAMMNSDRKSEFEEQGLSDPSYDNSDPSCEDEKDDNSEIEEKKTKKRKIKSRATPTHRYSRSSSDEPEEKVPMKKKKRSNSNQ